MSTAKSKRRLRSPSGSTSPPIAAPVKCGLVMPISEIDGCSEKHWRDVKTIVADAVGTIASPKFELHLVSDDSDIAVIHTRIFDNLHKADLVICDLSANNPNVLFELGMRFAFNKSAVLIKDDKTKFSFDTGPIEHLTYPRELRHADIVEFKMALATKVQATYEKSKIGGGFLKSFGIELPALDSPINAKPLEVLRAIRDHVAIPRASEDLEWYQRATKSVLAFEKSPHGRTMFRNLLMSLLTTS